MALRPQDRYQTPRALAADVEKWLADEATTAYREPWRVRLGRWVRRRQSLAAGLAAGLVVAVAAGMVVAWQLDRLRTEQRHDVESSLAEVVRLQGQTRWSEARAVLDQAQGAAGCRGAGRSEIAAGADAGRVGAGANLGCHPPEESHGSRGPL